MSSAPPSGFHGIARRTFDRVPLLLVATVLWFAFGLLAYLEFGVRPRSALGWVLLSALGPLAMLAYFVVGDLLSDGYARLPGVRQMRARVEKATSGQSFSVLRIAYGVVEGVLFLTLLYGALWLLGWRPD